jgi:hypothetical protein
MENLMFSVKDVVEMGHLKKIGGTVQIEFQFDEIFNSAPYLRIIDSLDHCLITDNESALKFSSRYFLLDNSTTLFEDVVTIMSHLIHSSVDQTFHEPTSIIVSIGKETFSSPMKYTSNVISYCNEG